MKPINWTAFCEVNAVTSFHPSWINIRFLNHIEKKLYAANGRTEDAIWFCITGEME